MRDDKRPIRIGLAGAAPDRGWARLAHVPAIAAVPTLSLHGVATRREASAKAAAAAFGAPLAFADPLEMIAHREIDAVSIAVKAPDHAVLVEAALRAGKPVYCEWPLGSSLTQSKALAALAGEATVTTAIGLQARHSPWVDQIRSIVRSGSLGRIVSTTLTAYDEFSVGSVEQGNVYMLDAANGANPLTIHAGHYIDALCFVLGELTSLSAALATSHPKITVRETGTVVDATSPDQTALIGTFAGGAIASVHIRPGRGGPSALWEIQGEQATLRISSTGYLMWRPLKVELWQGDLWKPIAPPAFDDGWNGVRIAEGPAQNVAYAYAAFASDIQTGSKRSVSFALAHQRHETIAAIERSSRNGTRQTLAANT